ncbi:MAG TPA: hypothetical protein VGD51_13040, partial [Nocardioidaceae bacterium]
MTDSNQQQTDPISATAEELAGTPRNAWGFGLATFAGVEGEGGVLDTWYPSPELGDAPEHVEPPEELTALEGADETRGVRKVVVRTVIEDLQAAPADAHDAWLRLHLLSSRQVAPRAISVDGIFGLL